MSDEERKQAQKKAQKRWRANKSNDAAWKAVQSARRLQWLAALPEERKEAIRQSRKAWRIANPERFREAIRRWEESHAERLKEAQRQWYAAHRDEVIEKSRRTKDQETAAMQFLRERGLLPPLSDDKLTWQRRSAALAYVRELGLL